MAIQRLGYFNTGAAPDYGVIGANKQRAYVPDALASTVIFYEMGARAGRVGSSTPVSRMGIGETSNNLATGSPDTLLAQTGNVSFSTQMLDGTQGATATASLTTPIIGKANRGYALVLTARDFSLGHAMIASAALPGKDNYQFYDKTNGSQSPTDPIGGSSIGVQGHMALWATGEVNVAPNTPTSLTPAGTLASTDLTPTMTSNFSDADETLPNAVAFDKLAAYQIEVRRKSDSVYFWQPGAFTASSSEQSARQSSRSYAGTTLVAGITYQQRVRHQDLAGAWSSWTAWTDFTINAGGTVTVAGATPTGKQNSTTPGPFVATWNHPNPLNADRAIVRVLDSNLNVLQTMTTAAPYTLSPTVANLGSISVPWANTGFTALSRSASQRYWQISARDTATAWSPWSASVPLTINATPNTPASLSPNDSTHPVSTAPKLSMTLSDPDTSDPASGLVGSLEIKRADTTSVTRVPTYNAVTKKHEYQTVVGTNEVQRITPGGTITGGTFTITVPTNARGAAATTAAINFNDAAATVQTKLEALANVGAGRIAVTGGPINAAALTLTYLMELSATDVSQITVTSSLTGTAPTITPSTVTAGVAGDWAGFQTLQWRATASDGVSTSPFSSYATFIYAAVPSVTITAPLDEATVTTATYRIAWTTSASPQVKYQVTLTEVDALDVPVTNGQFYDSGLVVSANLFHDLPVGTLRTGKRLQLVTAVTDGTPLTGYSTALQFNVTYVPPEALTGLSATPTAVWSVTDSDAMYLAWNPTTRAGDQFRGYDIWRTALGPAQQANGFVAADIEEDVGTRVFMRRLDNPAQAAWVDANPTSGVLYQYDVEQVVQVGVDELRSTMASVSASVAIPNVVLSVALEGETYGIELRYKNDKGAYLSSDLTLDNKKSVPIGGVKGRSNASPYLSWSDSGTFKLVTTKNRSADQQLRQLMDMVNLGVRTLCLRDFTGLKRFLTLDGLKVDRFSVNHYEITPKFSEEWFIEGSA